MSEAELKAAIIAKAQRFITPDDPPRAIDNLKIWLDDSDGVSTAITRFLFFLWNFRGSPDGKAMVWPVNLLPSGPLFED